MSIKVNHINLDWWLESLWFEADGAVIVDMSKGHLQALISAGGTFGGGGGLERESDRGNSRRGRRWVCKDVWL